MATHIDFSKFAMNRLKLEKITKADLVGLVYNLQKGTCQSRIELEYNMEECYKDLSNQLDWANHGPKRQLFYRSQINRLSQHDVYSALKILSVVSVTVDKQFGYGYLKEIMMRREDRKLYTLKEGDFINLHMKDIEDMLLLVVQHKLFHLEGDAIVDLVVALRMFTRRIVIQKRVKDVPLGVESYQKKLNITKPQKDFPTISAKEPYTLSFDPQGSVRDTLYYRMLNLRLGYNKDMPRRKWTTTDQRRSCIMVKLIEEQLLERWIIRNLERLISRRKLEMDYILLQRTA
ncbi:hypothetical protein Tco_1508534 [Tanacetum coccineum]